MTLAEYYAMYGTRITQQSERLFLEDFLYPMLGVNIDKIIPQFVFLDRTGRSRKIDFAYSHGDTRIALEVNGETYHAEGIIPHEQFDDNLFRQNEIQRRGFKLARFSYSQLQSAHWRPIVKETLRNLFAEYAPDLLSDYTVEPNPIQLEALDALHHARSMRGWDKGVVVMPTGTGKTILSALDARRHGGRVLFLVHRLDILAQSRDAYHMVWGALNDGLLTGDETFNEINCDVLFASKDTLRQPTQLQRYPRDWFDYIVVDEVHHGQTPSYRNLFQYFRPRFILGMTATPDRTDRKDIFELFDYNKVYEIPLSDVIERGFLVPYTYIGLTDNIDYSHIRYQNNRYRVDDLERYLIIPERNRAILEAYTDPTKGAGDKAIGFCVSIAHATRMAQYFSENGISAAAVHSESPDRDQIIAAFRRDELQVVFTVDLFNEGIDFPNVRVLLFLRPTESKTVFLQQLGRGLRLCVGKDRVRILDFIGNYNRANQIRKYLAKSCHRSDEENGHGNRLRKMIYEYSNGCEVLFDAHVEEILNQQDAADIPIEKSDLIDAYFSLAERLLRKPTKAELDDSGEYASRLYVQKWNSWRNFLQDINEYTEASYHYPQGTHLGHVLSILWYFGLPNRAGTHCDDRYIRMRGNLDGGRTGVYQRQLKYKLQATMELGLIDDDRLRASDNNQPFTLSPSGAEIRALLEPELVGANLGFPVDADGVPSSRMNEDESYYNCLIARALTRVDRAGKLKLYEVFIGMHAVQQMMAFLYQILRRRTVEKRIIYEGFFATPFVRRFCEQEGIEEASIEAARRRCPFILNVLESCGVVTLSRSDVVINRLLITPSLVQPFAREDRAATMNRFNLLRNAWPNNAENIPAEDLSILRELFGANLLTDDYTWTNAEFSEIEYEQ